MDNDRPLVNALWIDGGLVSCEVAYYHVKHTVVGYGSGDQQLENKMYIL